MTEPSRLGASPRLLLACLLSLLLLAGLVRLKNIEAPGVLVEREYVSAILARAFYLDHHASVEPWRREIAQITKLRQPVLEPPVTEYLVSLIYRVAGREELWYARFLTSAFWLAGGFFMFRIAQVLFSDAAAVFATAYYLLVPEGVLLSRSFQPDSLMMMMFLASIYFILRYFQRASMSRLVVAVLLSGLTLLVRPLVLFAIFGAYVSMSIYQRRSLRSLIDRPFLIFCLATLAFPVAYYGYGFFVAGFLRGQAAMSFRPDLLARQLFWRNWFNLGMNYVGPSALVASLLGFAPQQGRARALGVGLSVGYLLFGLVFTHHIHTHPYYHAQLIPVVGLGLAPLLVRAVSPLRDVPGRTRWVRAVGALLITLYVGYLQVRDSLYAQVFEPPEIAQEVGEFVQHSDRVVFVAYHYGLPLQYYGELSGASWPKSIEDLSYGRPGERERSVEERIRGLGFAPEYYVITHFGDYAKRHPDLRAYLEHNCAVLAESDQYLIYESCVQ